MKKALHYFIGIIAILCVFSTNVYSTTTTMDNTVFTILRHVRNANDNQLWQKCYSSIRKFYPDNTIVIIDDNSKFKCVDDGLYNTIVIKSEFPGAGELLPYYYFLKHKWSDRMIFLHDSMFLKREFNEDELNSPVKFHWHFVTHQYDNSSLINSFLSRLNNHKELIEYYRDQPWYGCFGVTSIINLNVLEEIEAEYAFTTSLIDKIKCREDRMCLERIFAVLMFKDGYITQDNCSNFGSIFDAPGWWGYMDENAASSAIIKKWCGR